MEKMSRASGESEQVGFVHAVEDGKCAEHGCQLVPVCQVCTGVGVKMHSMDFVREHIRGEIEARQSMMRQMVGNLYPGILRDEIERLEWALKALGVP